MNNAEVFLDGEVKKTTLCADDYISLKLSSLIVSSLLEGGSKSVNYNQLLQNILSHIREILQAKYAAITTFNKERERYDILIKDCDIAFRSNFETKEEEPLSCGRGSPESGDRWTDGTLSPIW